MSQDTATYCKNCGWNNEKATAVVRDDLHSMWIPTVVAIIVVPLVWKMGGTQRTGAAIGLVIIAVVVPLVLFLIAKRRLARLAAPMPCAPQEVPHEASPVLTTGAAADQEKDVLLAMHPRRVRLTGRGYSFVFLMFFATQLVTGMLFVTVWGNDGQWHVAFLKNALALLIWSTLLWRCVSFFRNRIRERRLFLDGEFSHGIVVVQGKTAFGSQIVYRYPDLSGNLHQNHATDFNGTLYEDMPLHVFYDQIDSAHSASLESSLFRIG